MRAFAALLLIGCSAKETSPPAAHSHADSGHDDAATRHSPDAGADTIVESPPKVPGTLAETGLYADFAARTLVDGVIPFEVRYPLWSDGAEKSRWLWVPPGQQIDTADMDHWRYPTGTKAWKEFRRDGVLVETRYLEKSGEPPIGWKFVAYIWSADGKSAVAAPAGITDALGTPHDVPSQEQCEQCHSGTRDVLIGVNAIQLSRESGKSALATLSEKGLLSKPPGKEFTVPGTGTVQDALGYLHGNCGYCHSDTGRWAKEREIRLRVRVGDTTPESTATYLTTINVKMHHGDMKGTPYTAVVPGDPVASHVYDRMIKRDFWAMPPVGSEVVDPNGTAVVRAWIASLPK